MRSSGNMRIGKHGIKDNQFGITYFSPWVLENIGRDVYLRRDPKDYAVAWVFDASNDIYLGEVSIRDTAAAFADTPIERAKLQEMLSIQRRQKRQSKEPGAVIVPQAKEVILDSLLKSANLFGNNVPEQRQNVIKIVRTPLDGVAKERRLEAQEVHYQDDHAKRILSEYVWIEENGRKIKPVLELDSDWDYFEAHETELIRAANGVL